MKSGYPAFYRLADGFGNLQKLPGIVGGDTVD